VPPGLHAVPPAEGTKVAQVDSTLGALHWPAAAHRLAVMSGYVRQSVSNPEQSRVPQRTSSAAGVARHNPSTGRQVAPLLQRGRLGEAAHCALLVQGTGAWCMAP
jgi:hypothetical protein